jgi:hypothetical protein
MLTSLLVLWAASINDRIATQRFLKLLVVWMVAFGSR